MCTDYRKVVYIYTLLLRCVVYIHRPYLKRRNRQQRATAAVPFAVRATTLMHSRLFRLARSRWISGANSHLTLDAYILYPYTTAYSLLYFFFTFREL